MVLTWVRWRGGGSLGLQRHTDFDGVLQWRGLFLMMTTTWKRFRITDRLWSESTNEFPTDRIIYIKLHIKSEAPHSTAENTRTKILVPYRIIPVTANHLRMECSMTLYGFNRGHWVKSPYRFRISKVLVNNTTVTFHSNDNVHWNVNGVILTKYPSLTTPDIAIVTRGDICEKCRQSNIYFSPF